MSKKNQEAIDIKDVSILEHDVSKMIEMLSDNLMLAKKVFDIVAESDPKRALALCAMLSRRAHLAAHAALARHILEQSDDLHSIGKEDAVFGVELPEMSRFFYLATSSAVQQDAAKDRAAKIIDKVSQDPSAKLE